MNRRLQLFKYIISDIITALVAWCLYFHYLSNGLIQAEVFDAYGETLSKKFLPGLFIVPLFWLLLNYLSGYYNDVIRKSRLFELWQTFINVIVGSVTLYLVFNFQQFSIEGLSSNFSTYFTYFLLQFFISYVPRLILTSITAHKVHRGTIGFNTLLIGSSAKAFETWQEVVSQKRGNGNKFIGYVSVNNGSGQVLEKFIPYLGKIEDLNNIITQFNVEEVIIAIEYSEHDMINLIINKLINVDVEIKAIPSLYDILTGRVRMSSILGTPLISVSHNPMPAWQHNMKTFLDHIIAVIALILSLPLSIFLAVGIKLTSRGPIFYSHERVGQYGKPFRIYKFRSMYIDAEKDGPELSSKDDERVTRFGKFMRMFRLDEIPNFFNVIKGDMSLVGPRPERKHYIEQIIQTAPHYLHLLKVKPGITSWGQVKFGYAENVNQMIQRLKYDLLYLDNMSLFVDFKILIYTALTIIKRKGI